MAAPTDVRVEAESVTTTRLRWTYAGSAAIYVYRSPDGVSYSEVTDGSTRPAVGTTEYEDIGLTEATKYWYKLSDDAGATFSSVVTVWTHTCNIPVKSANDGVPPAPEEYDSRQIDDITNWINKKLVRFTSPDGKTCLACVDDGALVIDCIQYDKCETIEVPVDQDINSISLPNCDDSQVDVQFIVPANATRKIGGWPRGIGFTGDEGYRAPIRGGSSGRRINETIGKALNENSKSGKSKSGTASQGTATGGQSRTTGTCTCTPTSDGGMRIVACKPNGTSNKRNSLNCSDTNKGAKLIVCGGRGPYTWSKTGSITLSATSGNQVSVSVPTNSGSGVAGTAYIKYGGRCDSGGGAPVNCAGATWLAVYSQSFKCDDTAAAGSPGTCGSVTTQPAANSCRTAPDNLGGGSCSSITSCHDGGTCTYGTCDARSAAMISNGCNPCGVQAGATVTATDADGVSVTVVMAS